MLCRSCRGLLNVLPPVSGFARYVVGGSRVGEAVSAVLGVCWAFRPSLGLHRGGKMSSIVGTGVGPGSGRKQGAHYGPACAVRVALSTSFSPVFLELGLPLGGTADCAAPGLPPEKEVSIPMPACGGVAA